MVQEQQNLIKETRRIAEIFKTSEGELRPHFILTGPSGSGKSHIIKKLAEESELGFLEINAAALTKEGTSGNSLSKALSPLRQNGDVLTICFVDEFDKLFISGNNNSELAHETTNGVQNEFLKVLESSEASVFGDYGKYVNVSVDNVLFVFAGAFNGEDNLDTHRLKELGVKTEFLGRVGLIYNTEKLSLESLYHILENSEVLDKYLEIFPDVKKLDAVTSIKEYLAKNYDQNTLGIRLVNSLIAQYFIKGGILFEKKQKKRKKSKSLKLNIEA